ncbi:MAG: [protein-PII] uridylyltransferase family protein [Armatimonadota bacterium]
MKNIKTCISANDLGEFILSERDRLAGQPSMGGVAFMRAYSGVVDMVITRAFQLSMEEASQEIGIELDNVSSGVSIIATGGYGRREMSPMSDIDITFIVADEDDPRVDLLVKRAYRFLMDVLLNGAGLKVGYAYRQISDCQDLPLETHTALLDARHITGSTLLFDKFYTAILRAITPAAFILGHLEQRRIVSAQWGSSPYRVEPNVKEGSGGQRDLQAARWMAQVAFGVSGDTVWHVLRSRGIVSDQELQWIEGAAEFIAKIRNSLHMVCKRGSDLLTIERQEEIASMKRFRLSPSALMSRYYLHAERVAGVYRKVASACSEQALEIEPGVVVQRGEIGVPDKGLLFRDPAAVVRIFEHMITHGLSISWETSDLLREYASARDGRRLLRAGKVGGPSWLTAQAFLRVLSHRNAADALESMTRIGVLQWLVPEFARVMHLIPGDAAHELTVGAHSLEVTQQLALFAGGGIEDELRDISSNVQEPELLCLAALLHDAGKSEEDGPHEEKGAVMISSVGRRLGLRSEAVSQLEFIVTNHLLMAETARLRDLNESRTVEDFVEVVDTQEKLDMLYLLTAADLRSVGQATWSGVQMRFLRELYHRASTVLRSTGVAVDIERHRGRLVRELSLANLPKEEVDEHCSAMPAGYLLNTAPDDLAAHIAYVRSARAGEPVVRLKDDVTGRFTVITLCALDDPTPGLLSKITGVLVTLGIGIHAAQVFTRESSDRIAIDQLYVDFDHRTLPVLRRLQVQSELVSVLLGKIDIESLMSRYGKNMRGEVVLQNMQVMSNLSDRHTVIEIEADDQPGLLYKLTKAISSVGWDIHSARVSTWGNKARDAFYVTAKDGSKLDAGAAETLRKAITGLSQAHSHSVKR